MKRNWRTVLMRMIDLIGTLGATTDQVAAELHKADVRGLPGDASGDCNPLCLFLTGKLGYRVSWIERQLGVIAPGGHVVVVLPLARYLRVFLERWNKGVYTVLNLRKDELHMTTPFGQAHAWPTGVKGVGWIKNSRLALRVDKEWAKRSMSGVCRGFGVAGNTDLFYPDGTWPIVAYDVREIRRMLMSWIKETGEWHKGDEAWMLALAVNQTPLGRRYLEAKGSPDYFEEGAVLQARQDGKRSDIIWIQSVGNAEWEEVSRTSVLMADRQGRSRPLYRNDLEVIGSDKKEDCAPWE